ncbi:MAG: tRNA (adenosine(37)-N6)-threonylcarbamoyltransferase complex dimerization subunit type 1 TsaB [Syntrophomonadaceae bacterium]|nr:tRNA (adenosine(37)-N6)-threonylcarbamoyltransferase complex dimerization subunit type 1 TsaB [Syntrophomonadaceae bacterium]
MRILAIDSATPVAGVALLNDGILLKEEFSNYKKTHSETLMPMVDRVLRECECTVNDVDALAVTIGPGSFTGLRIGLALVKGLALATGIPVVGVSTLEVIAFNIYDSDALVCPLLNARKGEVYCAFYQAGGIKPVSLADMRACSPEEFVQQALTIMDANNKTSLILLGDGFSPYQEFFLERLGDKMVSAPPHLMLPRASALAQLAADRVNNGQFDNVFTLSPVYIRLSEAEYRLGRGAV